MTNIIQKDILIIGGGPAGLSTALHLQRMAPHLVPETIILEKAYYPRPKLCAGGLVVDAEIILHGLGLDTAEIPHVDAESTHFLFGDKGLSIHLPNQHALRIIRRDEFDSWLASKARSAGVQIQQGITVTAIHPDLEGVTVETNQGTYRANILIGADGSNGITRHCMTSPEPVQTARLLEVLVHPANAEQKNLPREAYFEFAPIQDGVSGYVWNFPTQVQGQMMECWGIYDANMSKNGQRGKLKDVLFKEMAKAGYTTQTLNLKGHPLHWYHPAAQISTSRVLLVGDAAGADPIFGEGISIALGYGKIAAEEIVRAYKKNDFSLTGYKARIDSSPLGKTLRARWFIARTIYFFRFKWFHFLLWRVLKPVVLWVAWVFVLNWAKHPD